MAAYLVDLGGRPNMGGILQLDLDLGDVAVVVVVV
jgi:hypothetical protein